MIPQDFKDCRVAITGAGGGYGRDLALAFHRRGAKLFLSDRTASIVLPAELDAVDFEYCQADLTSDLDLQTLVARMLQSGTPDLLINNAGVYPFVNLMDATLEDFDAMLNVNLRAPFYLTQKIGGAMVERSRGAICNISSAAANVIRDNGAIYGASKAGLEHLTQAFALRFGSAGVRVNGVRPGLRGGDTIQHIPESHLSALTARSLLRRLATPGEVAEVVCFLCSDQATFITGEVLAVDGGARINRRAT